MGRHSCRFEAIDRSLSPVALLKGCGASILSRCFNEGIHLYVDKLDTRVKKVTNQISTQLLKCGMLLTDRVKSFCYILKLDYTVKYGKWRTN